MTAKTAQAACLCGQLACEITLPSWNFRIVRGAEHLTWHRSSPGSQRGFCNQCGSPLLFRSTRWPGETHVTYASFTTPLDRTPAAHVFWDTHVDWVELADTLPRRTSAELARKAP